MEKIVLVLNAKKPDIASIDFACSIAKLSDSKLTGLIIENPYLELLPGDTDKPLYFEKLHAMPSQVITTEADQSIRLFKEECQRRQMAAEVYVDEGEPMQEAIFESRFSDLLLINPCISFYNKEESLPSHFLKEILAKAECPVLLTAEKFVDFEEIVFCYDGSASSVFAIKLFTYLFPEFGDKKAVVLEVNDRTAEELRDSHRRMMSWLQAHYHSVFYHELKGDVKDALFEYFFMKEKKWIVMGAYGRSLLSTFFRKSSADVLLRIINLPIFITHH